MVKQLNIILDDNEHERLTKRKGQRSWHDFIMELAR